MKPPFRSHEPLHRRNGKIRARVVRVLDETKQQLGVMSLNEALRIAQDKGLDLIEVAAEADPPVCRIADYGKFLYEESKKKSHSRSRAGQVKEIQISPAIDPHDLATKRNHAIQFLSEGMKVRVILRFRGRQKAHKEIGFEVIKKFVNDLASYAQADAPPKMLGDRDINVILSPLSRHSRAQNPRPSPTPPPGKRPKSEAPSMSDT